MTDPYCSTGSSPTAAASTRGDLSVAPERELSVAGGTA